MKWIIFINIIFSTYTILADPVQYNDYYADNEYELTNYDDEQTDNENSDKTDVINVIDEWPMVYKNLKTTNLWPFILQSNRKSSNFPNAIAKEIKKPVGLKRKVLSQTKNYDENLLSPLERNSGLIIKNNSMTSFYFIVKLIISL